MKSRKRRKITIYPLTAFLFSRALCNSQSVFFHAVYTQKLLAQALFLARAQIIARSWLDGLLALIQSKGSLPDCFQTISIVKVQARFPGLLRDRCTRCRAILWQAMPGFGGFPGLPRALPRRRALLGFFPFGKSRLLRNTYKCKPFLRIAYDLLGLHKIKRLHLCIITTH